MLSAFTPQRCFGAPLDGQAIPDFSNDLAYLLLLIVVMKFVLDVALYFSTVEHIIRLGSPSSADVLIVTEDKVLVVDCHHAVVFAVVMETGGLNSQTECIDGQNVQFLVHRIGRSRIEQDVPRLASD